MNIYIRLFLIIVLFGIRAPAGAMRADDVRPTRTAASGFVQVKRAFFYRIVKPGDESFVPVFVWGSQHDVPLECFPKAIVSRVKDCDMLIVESDDEEDQSLPEMIKVLCTHGFAKPTAADWVSEFLPDTVKIHDESDAREYAGFCATIRKHGWLKTLSQLGQDNVRGFFYGWSGIGISGSGIPKVHDSIISAIHPAVFEAHIKSLIGGATSEGVAVEAEYENGMDHELEDYFHAAGKSIHYLESESEAMILSNLPLVFSAMKTYSGRFDIALGVFEKVVSEKIDLLVASSEAKLGERDGSTPSEEDEEPSYYDEDYFDGDLLLTDEGVVERNKIWVTRLPEYLAKPGSKAIVVGADHLGGPTGVLTWLIQQKYEVYRVSTDGRSFPEVVTLGMVNSNVKEAG